jgi:hypothetical protein
MSSSKRHFTAVVNSKEHGLYISASPSSAARKIVSKLCASSKSKKVEFCVREITQGSKKKTYGPYLGEMKKLAKPIELKGRIIRFDIKVHLKKKKTGKKIGKKVGKKMRGGTITDGGELDENDFIIKEEKLQIGNIVEYENQYYSPYGQGHNKITYHILNYDNIQPCELIRKNDIFEEPFIFFGKKIHGTLVKGSKKVYSNKPIVYYEYVAFNKGRFSKTAIFNKLVIYEEYSHHIESTKRKYLINPDSYNTSSVHSDPHFTIEKIPKEALEELNVFIERERLQNLSFCKTIYNAVIKELYLRKNNTDTMFYREINRIEDHEKK